MSKFVQIFFDIDELERGFQIGRHLSWLHPVESFSNNHHPSLFFLSVKYCRIFARRQRSCESLAEFNSIISLKVIPKLAFTNGGSCKINFLFGISSPRLLRVFLFYFFYFSNWRVVVICSCYVVQWIRFA